MNIAGLIITAALTLVTLTGRPQRALLAIVAAVCYLPQAQYVSVFGFNFTAIRAVLFFGTIRVVSRREYIKLKIGPIEKAILAYAFAATFFELARRGTTEALIYTLGCDYDIFLPYFVFRILFNLSDPVRFIKELGIVLCPVACMMIMDAAANFSVFRILFGEYTYVDIRNGHIRSPGVFQNCITGGIFGATLTSLFCGLFQKRDQRKAAVIGIISCVAITIASHSSGALMALVTSFFAIGCWRLRRNMKVIRWGLLGLMICLHLVMKAPVWFIVDRVAGITGGGGFYRSELISQAFAHLNEWWLMGTDFTGHWMATTLENGQADITNQYLRAGVHGGIVSALLFLLIPVRCFQLLGRAMKMVRETGATEIDERILWAAGCLLTAHVITIFTVSYFDQMGVAFYMELALIAKLSDDALSQNTR